MVDEMKGIKRDPLLDEADELWDAYSERRTADEVVTSVFRNGTFTGELYNTLGLNVPSAHSKKLLVNLTRAAVIDRATMLTMLPDYKYSVPFTPEPEVALTEQDILINTHLSFWEFWRMKQLLRTQATNMSLKNRCLWLLFPDFNEKKPKLYGLDPSMLFGEMDNSGEIPRVFLIQDMRGRQILAQYPDAKNYGVTNDDNEFRIVDFWDKNIKRLFINDHASKVGSIDHDLGFVPIRYTQDTHIPGTIDNMGNAYQNIALAENFTDMLILQSQEMRRRINSVPWVKGGISKSNYQAALAGKEILDLENDGEFGFAQAIQGNLGTQQHLSALEQLFRTGMNWPAMRSGQIDSSIWTAKGINAASGGVNDDILATRELMADDLQWLDYAAIHMWRKMWGNTEHNLLNFNEKNVIGSVKVIPKKDIPNDFRHELVTFALAHDVTGKAILLMQLFGQKLIDRRSVLEQMPGFNPNEVLQRLEEDMVRDVGWQMKVQSEALKLQNEMAPPPEQVDQENVALEKGTVPDEAGQLVRGMVPTPDPRSAGFTGGSPGLV